LVPPMGTVFDFRDILAADFDGSFLSPPASFTVSGFSVTSTASRSMVVGLLARGDGFLRVLFGRGVVAISNVLVVSASSRNSGFRDLQLCLINR
jgi:hypothetical protein